MNSSENDRKILPGGALVLRLLEEGAARGLDKAGIADEIGITYPYFCALTNGSRPISGISHDKLRSIGHFLGIPFVQVLMLAEIVTPSDFAMDQKTELQRTLELAWTNMRAHPEWGRAAPTPSEWAELGTNTKIGIALMWEKISGQDLVEKAKLIKIDKSMGVPLNSVKVG